MNPPLRSFFLLCMDVKINPGPSPVTTLDDNKRQLFNSLFRSKQKMLRHKHHLEILTYHQSNFQTARKMDPLADWKCNRGDIKHKTLKQNGSEISLHEHFKDRNLSTRPRPAATHAKNTERQPTYPSYLQSNLS